MIEIRAYHPNDEQSVIHLWKTVFPEAPPRNDPRNDIQTKSKLQPDLFLVALAGKQLIGTAMAGFDGHRGWVYYLAVAPDYQRQGIGTAIMQMVEESLAQMGCPKLNLQIRADNAEVQAFYESLGYDVEQRISMGKELSQGIGQSRITGNQSD